MRITRRMRAVGIVASATLALVACGTDENPGSISGNENSDASCQGKETLAASGSSAQVNAMTRFVATYESVCPGKTLNYNSSGSGAGVSDFIGGQTDFAGSDSPLNEEKGEVADAKERCDGNDAWHLPAVFGPIAISYNVEGVDTLARDGATLAKIFNGDITKWNDPAIAELNGGVTLPDTNIRVVYRNDQSGTTDNFQKYLGTASGDAWGKGDGKTFNGGVGEGAKGNEGVTAAVKRTPGSITYNEWSFSKLNELSIADIINAGGGEPVELNTESAGKAIDAAEIKGKGNDLVLDLDSIYGADAEGAYPIILATYEIVCSSYADPEVAAAVKSFLTVAITGGQQGLEEDGYIPVPAAFQEKLRTAVEAIS